MTEITIEALRKRDYRKAIEFAIEGMHFDRYVDNSLALRLYGRYFLYLELERASQVLAAYQEDRFMGVLIADIENEPKLHSSFWRKLYVKVAEAVIALLFKDGPDVYDEANEKMIGRFRQNHALDGELCFLAADPTAQGKGIGTKLLDEFSRREKDKLIYLYTDDNCTYQFYECKGFERSEEITIEMELSGKVVPLTCLLYSKQL